jgi:hypothetical protein
VACAYFAEGYLWVAHTPFRPAIPFLNGLV